MNNVKVFGLMALLTGLFAAVGGAIGGSSGIVIALLLAGGMNLFAYWNSARMVLRMYGAREVSPESAPALHRMVDRLRLRAGLPMPTLAVAPHAQPNAFATGRNPRNAVVCVTEGLLELLTEEELEGVIAHELAHIRNHDMLLQTFTATLAGAVSSLGQMAMWSSLFGGGDEDDGGGLVMALVAPLAAGLVQMAISRQREFKADAVGAEICGRPLALAGALRRLEAQARRIPMHVSPAAAPLAQVNPLAAAGGRMARLFGTHPPTEERVRRLQELARAA
jgi:heat shock protein HtpX